MLEETLLAMIEDLKSQLEDLRNVRIGFTDDMGPQGSPALAPDFFDADDGGGAGGSDPETSSYGLEAATGQVIRVYNASIQHGSFWTMAMNGSLRYREIEVLGGTLASPHWICCRYRRKISLEVVTPALDTVPNVSPQYFWYPVAAVYLSGGQATIAYSLVTSMPIFPEEI
jgi:hypothetical protein